MIVNVVDASCGIGKTTSIINMIKITRFILKTIKLKFAKKEKV